MSEQIDIDINVNMNNSDEVDDLTAKLQEATDQVDELTTELANIELGNSDADFDSVASALEDAESEAENLQSQLDDIGNTTVSPTVEVDNSSIDETKEKLEDTEESASSLTTAIGGIAGVVGVEQMISTADSINNSWNRLNLTFADTGVSLDELKTKTGQAADATGMSGGEVRGYFNSMGIAGIKNADLLSSSFQSLAGKSYQTGQSIQGMESKVQKMVMTGNASSKMLTGLGITTEDLGRAMGVSGDEAKKAFEALDQEGRLQAITTAMGDGAEANRMYKDSYEGLKNQAMTAMSGLMGAIGQGILPVINPLIQSATGFVKGFTNSFKELPGPIQGVVGSIGGFLAVGTATIGILGVVGQVGSGVVSGLKSMKEGYNTVKGAMSTARAVMTALTSAESISEGVRAALAVATGAETAAEGANATAKTAATGPTMGLAIAENSLLLPLLLVIGAVIAVIAIMWYLYNTNETVRNGINWLIAQVQSFVTNLINAAQGVLSFVTYIATHMNQLPGMIWNALLKAISFVGQWASNMLQKGISAAHSFVNNVSSVFRGIVGKITGALSGVVNAITKPFRDAWSYVKPYVDKIKEGLDFINPFNGFEGYASFDDGSDYGINNTLNGSISGMVNNTSSNLVVNNNFNGLVEESAADYIVSAVNDRLRREKLLKGA